MIFEVRWDRRVGWWEMEIWVMGGENSHMFESPSWISHLRMCMHCVHSFTFTQSLFLAFVGKGSVDDRFKDSMSRLRNYVEICSVRRIETERVREERVYICIPILDACEIQHLYMKFFNNEGVK